MTTETRTIPAVDQNYPGFCCQGFDYLICYIFLGRGDPADASIWGQCLNPDCPNEDSVSDHLLDDLEDTLEEKGIKVKEVSSV